MGSPQKDDEISVSDVEEKEGFLEGMSIASGMVLNFVLKAACELDLFDLIAKAAGPDAQLTAAEIALLLPTQNEQAPRMLDRMLAFLACHSFFNCKVVTDENGDNPKRLYSLASRSKILIKNEDGVSLAPMLLVFWDKVTIDACCHLKDAILDGGAAFDIAHGMNAFQYPEKDSRYNDVFNKAMFNHTSMVMKRFLEVYNGFDGVTELVDVGGGFGATAGAIVSKYKNLRAINFDLPHVIQNAPPQKGVEHKAGDMFESVPAGELILLKWVLHDWSDGHCVKVLRNCFKAVPETGKLIIMETVLQECPDGGLLPTIGFQWDVSMMTINSGGKERTLREFQLLAEEAGFTSIKLVCRAYSYWVVEFLKN